MEEEFHGGLCGGNWWNPSRIFGSSPCHSAGNWLHHGGVIVGVKTATSISDDSAGSASDGGSSVLLQDGNMSVVSTLQTMGISRSSSSPTDDWNQDLIHDNGRSHEYYSPILQALDPSMNCRQKTADNWNGDSFKQRNPGFPQEQQKPNSFTNFPLINPASYSYPSSFLQTLFDTDSPATATSFSSSPNYPMSSSQILPRQQPGNNLQFANNAPFWNAGTAASSDVRASFLHSTQPQLIPSSLSKAKLNPPNVTAKRRNEKAGDTDTTACKKVANEGALKRPRIETPSPLPTFKVRKEKLGDRVTALQQLVSPFGKTDTASVLHEAIEYIKLLHDQVGVLSTPYLKIGAPPLQRPQALDKIKDQEEPMKDLKSRGLCLVPISSTFPVAAETTTDFWTPTFGGSFR